MRVDTNQVVTFHFKLCNQDGVLIDSSEGDLPMSIIQHSGRLLPALEDQLQGHVAGDVFKATLAPDQAYGPVHQELMQTIPRHAFDGQQISVGSRFKAKGKNDQEQMLTVKEIGQNDVTVDANHPLAGQTLVFDIAIVSVREATKEELENGEVTDQKE